MHASYCGNRVPLSKSLASALLETQRAHNVRLLTLLPLVALEALFLPGEARDAKLCFILLEGGAGVGANRLPLRKTFVGVVTASAVLAALRKGRVPAFGSSCQTSSFLRSTGDTVESISTGVLFRRLPADNCRLCSREGTPCETCGASCKLQQSLQLILATNANDFTQATGCCGCPAVARTSKWKGSWTNCQRHCPTLAGRRPNLCFLV